MNPTNSVRAGGSAFSLVLIGLSLFEVGCGKNPITTWSAEAKSPDGNWLAMARSQQWSGPGNAYDATTVTLKQAGGTQPPIEILEFEQNRTRMDLNMTWISPTHLNVEYGSDVRVLFQAVRAFGEIEITTQKYAAGTP
jgi:hypothetical protein